MEFLRFGSLIPGSYWGCCACDIIQNFKVDPDAKASIQLSSGDGGAGIPDQFLGGTWKDIFLQRLRIGTFGGGEMPDHAFIAILTGSQVASGVGKKWMAILKETGFEFIRRQDNSVYTGSTVAAAPVKADEGHANYIFALFRNVGTGSFKDQFTPPAAWTNLPEVVPEAWNNDTSTKAAATALTKRVFDAQKTAYEALPAPNRMTEKQLDSKGIPVTYAGQRPGGSSPNYYTFQEGAPQETRENRQRRLAERAALRTKAPAANAFPVKAVVAPAPVQVDVFLNEMG